MKSNEQLPMLIPYQPNELLDQIRNIIRSELNGSIAANQEVQYSTTGLTQKPLYKALEVCKMLTISRQTLHAWVKEGLLKQYKVKSRSYYLWTDIEKLVKIQPD